MLLQCKVWQWDGERFWVLLVSSSWPPFFPPFYSQSLLSISRSHQCSASPLTGRTRQISVIVTPWINQEGMLWGVGLAVFLAVSPQLCVQPPLAQDVRVVSLILNLSLLYGTTPLGQLKVNTFKCFLDCSSLFCTTHCQPLFCWAKLTGSQQQILSMQFYNSIHEEANRCTEELCHITVRNAWWVVGALNPICCFCLPINSAE